MKQKYKRHSYRSLVRIVRETKEQTLKTPSPAETHPKPTNPPPPNMVKPTQTHSSPAKQGQTHPNPAQTHPNPPQTQPKPTPNPPHTQHKPNPRKPSPGQTHSNPPRDACRLVVLRGRFWVQKMLILPASTERRIKTECNQLSCRTLDWPAKHTTSSFVSGTVFWAAFLTPAVVRLPGRVTEIPHFGNHNCRLQYLDHLLGCFHPCDQICFPCSSSGFRALCGPQTWTNAHSGHSIMKLAWCPESCKLGRKPQQNAA